MFARLGKGEGVGRVGSLGRFARDCRRSGAMARAALILSACLFSTRAAAFASAPYFPLPDGATWTYNVSDGTTETRTVAGTRSLNGAQDKIIRHQAGPERSSTSA